MENNAKNQEKLSTENIQTLKQNTSLTKKIAWLVGILFVCIIGRGFSVIDTNGYIVGVVCVGLVITIFFGIKYYIKNLEKDLENGYKNVVLTQIEDKIVQKASTFILVVEGERHLVTQQQYEQFSKGDFVRITLTPFSKTLLEIDKSEV